MTEQENFAQKLAKDAVDGLLKQAAKQGQQDIKEGEVTLDPETQRKIIEREVKMAADPDFALTEEAKLSAVDRMRRSRERPLETKTETKQESGKDKAALSQEISETGITMLRMGMPPEVVAQVMMGRLTPQVPINFGGGSGNQGLTLTDVLTLVDRMNASKASTELENTLKEMRDEIKVLRNQPKVERIDSAEAQASQINGLTSLVESLIKLGVVQRPSTEAAVEGKPLEVVREENRHNEKMEEIRDTKDYHAKIADAVYAIPEQIGAGLAARAESPQGNKVVAKTETQQYYDCEECHTKIPIPPGATEVTCPNPKCRAIYKK